MIGFEFTTPVPDKLGGLSLLDYLISHDRTGERDAFGAEFGFVNHHVDRVEDVWCLICRGIVIAPADWNERSRVLKVIKPAEAGNGLVYPRSLAGLRSVFAQYASYPAWWLNAKPAEVVEASAALRNLTRYAGWQLPLSASKKRSKSE